MFLDYEQRTAWKYEPVRGSFHTAASLSDKVNTDGSYASYPGNTVVFRPGKQCLQIVQMMQKIRLSEYTGIAGVEAGTGDTGQPWYSDR